MKYKTSVDSEDTYCAITILKNSKAEIALEKYYKTKSDDDFLLLSSYLRKALDQMADLINNSNKQP